MRWNAGERGARAWTRTGEPYGQDRVNSAAYWVVVASGSLGFDGKRSSEDKLALISTDKVFQTSTDIAMVGPLNTAAQAQQPKLDQSLDYDVLIIGAGQVSCLENLNHLS